MPGYSSFVVKIWSDRKRRILRGHIQHVATEESVRFVDMGKMVQFIIGHLPENGTSLGEPEGEGTEWIA